MKKIEEILHRERLTENPEFKAAYRDYQDARRRRDEAREGHRQARRTYRHAEENGEHDEDQLTELQLQLRQEKHLARYHREAYRLARHRLRSWIDSFLRRVLELRDSIADSLDDASEKTLSGDAHTPAHEMAPTPKTVLRVRRAAKAAPAETRDDDRTRDGKNSDAGHGKKKAAGKGENAVKTAETGRSTEPDDQRSRDRGRKSKAAGDHAVKRGKLADNSSDHEAKPTKRRGGKRTPSDD
jgi:hypothetical protein